MSGVLDEFRCGRFFANRATVLVAGDFALSAGWGATPTTTVGGSSRDTRGKVTLTPGGAGIGANPTWTLTFKDGTYTNAPFALVNMNALGTGAAVIVGVSTTATTMVVTYIGTPVGGNTYIFDWIVVG